MKDSSPIENNFVFASSKKWHYPLFENAKNEIPGKWNWVSSPEELEDACRENSPRYIFFFHWSWHVPRSIWERYECVCFHMTDVPYGRGGSPLQNLILAGHTSTRLSALRMVGEMDAGPVYAKKHLDLDGSAQSIYTRAGQLSANLMQWIISTEPVPVPQQGDVTLFKRRVPEQSCISEHGNIDSLYDFIRMLDADGYPHAFLKYGNYRFEFSRARKESSSSIVAEVRISHQHDFPDNGKNIA